MQRWRLGIFTLGILVAVITGLFPRDSHGRLYFLFSSHRPYGAAELMLLWGIEIVVVILLMVSFSTAVLLNARQRFLLRITALTVIGTVLFTPSSYGGLHYLFTPVRYLENAIDYSRLWTLWTSLGLACWSLFVAMSDNIRQPRAQRTVLIIGAMLFLGIGLFPARSGGLSTNPHLIYAVLDDEGDHRLNMVALILSWSIAAVSVLSIHKVLERTGKGSGR